MEPVIPFVKMHGLSNDFIVVDGPVALDPETVRRMCDRRLGIGADGLLAVASDDRSDHLTMQYWNADGTTAEMCGNGLRCVVRYAIDRELVRGPHFTVSTPAGDKAARLVDEGDMISVDLAPILVAPAPLDVGSRMWTLVDVGNPHAVTMVVDPATIAVDTEGPRVETDPAFPHGTNVEFAAIEGDRIVMRVWERGVGETEACGSGMVAVAAVARGLDPSIVSWRVDVPGGSGTVAFDGAHVWLTGPAVSVYEGVWPQ